MRSEFYFLVVFIHDLAEAEVRNLDLAIVKENVLRLQIIVDDLLLRLIQVLQTAEYLRDDQLGLLLRDLLVLLEVKVEVGSGAELEHRAKAIVVDLDSVELLDNPAVVQVFVDLVLSQCMLDVALLDLLAPAVVKVVDLAGDLAAALQVVPTVDLRVASLAEETQDQVLACEHAVALLGLEAVVLGGFLISDPLELMQIVALLLFKHLQLVSDPLLLVLKQLQLELVYLLLLILVDVVELRLLEVEFTRLVQEANRHAPGHANGTYHSGCGVARESIGGDSRKDALLERLLLIPVLLESLNLFLIRSDLL